VNADPEAVALAYNHLASVYDGQVAQDMAVRRDLWSRFDQLFHKGDRVLDVACGTGLDFLYLARRGVYVTALDISAGMLAICKERAREACLLDGIDMRQGDVGTLNTWRDAPYDGIISSFAGLNTASDLDQFARDAARLLRPGGHMLLHLLSVAHWRDIVALLMHGRLREARALTGRGSRTVVIGGCPITHAVYPPQELYQRYFAGSFALTRMHGTGVYVPLNLEHYPRVVQRILMTLERHTPANAPWASFGRHYLLELQRRGGAKA
jgi:ubiquinone/menaquinone biosynthesis C-methylase UbiE